MINRFKYALTGSKGTPMVQALVIIAIVVLLISVFIFLGDNIDSFGDKSGKYIMEGGTGF